MAYTMQQVVDSSRVPLNDAAKVRYPDAELLGYANDAVLILRSKRPDLFFGTYTALPGVKVLADAMPLDDTLYPAIADYVTARAETKNEESVVGARAALFFSLFKDSST